MEGRSEELAGLLPMLRGFARRALGADPAGEDLVQDALLAASEGLGGFRGAARLGTWVVGILSHKIVDHLRRRNRWREVSSDAGDEPGLLDAPSRGNPEQQLARREALRVIESALATLPERERLAVLLVDVHASDHDEACHALSVSATHLRVLLHRGRHRLRRKLEDADL
ncbi:MAG: sigma-70 family RNA polymerase sigma factor [Deltaproteobacteria bacterium]|nr:sigma-70 family RNA polymerase sigma factor [Deltaproteobacteria bacterium]